MEPTASENYMCANVLRGCLKIPHLLYHAKANSTTVKSGNKQIYALQDLPASLDIGICRPFGTACFSPPSPERAFSRKFERHHEIRIRHFMLFWSLRVEWDTFQFQKACETQKNVFVFLKSVSIPDLSPNYQL